MAQQRSAVNKYRIFHYLKNRFADRALEEIDLYYAIEEAIALTEALALAGEQDTLRLVELQFGLPRQVVEDPELNRQVIATLCRTDWTLDRRIELIHKQFCGSSHGG